MFGEGYTVQVIFLPTLIALDLVFQWPGETGSTAASDGEINNVENRFNGALGTL
jgi:hypothetical protein